MRSSNESGRGEFVKELGCAHIYELDISVGTHHEIFWLDVTIDYFVRVQVLETQNDLRDVESR